VTSDEAQVTRHKSQGLSTCDGRAPSRLLRAAQPPVPPSSWSLGCLLTLLLNLLLPVKAEQRALSLLELLPILLLLL